MQKYASVLISLKSRVQLFEEVESALQRTLPQARMQVTALEDTGLQLALINADFPTGPLEPDVMHAVIANPAYWAFCWGSGLATAQWIHAEPELVANKRIADLGCGSGVVAVSAALHHAQTVIACDIDQDALLATAANAELNNVDVQMCENLDLLPNDLDILFLADVLYDRSNFALIEAAKHKAKRLIIADSRVSDVEDVDFVVTRAATALTYPNLGEFDEFRNVKFFEYWRPE